MDALRVCPWRRPAADRGDRIAGTGVGLSAQLRGSVEALIDLGALRENFVEARRRSGGRDVIAVVKAEAYGHGASRVARELVAAGCRQLAVATVAEGVALRDAGIDLPILVFAGARDPQEAEAAVGRGLTPVVHAPVDLERVAGAAREASRRIDVHVEVDTGMNRMGVAPDEAASLCERVAAEPAVRLEGVYTHFARADEVDLAPSLAQLQRFRELLEALRKAGLTPQQIHVANSAGLLAGSVLADALPEANAVRPGLMLYGVRPAPHLLGRLRPVMTLRCRVAMVRPLRAGQAVGYGAQYRAERDTRIATLPLGYADGVPVAASNRGEVWIGGRRFRIAGRVSMDAIGVDVGDAAVAVGDEVILFGGAGEAVLPVEDAAAAAQTIPYELLVRIGQRVPRRILAGSSANGVCDDARV
jgi:alanine racemase